MLHAQHKNGEIRQGPQNRAIRRSAGDTCFMGGGISNFDYQSIQNDYHIVVISMPKTPIVACQDELNSSYWVSAHEDKPNDDFLENDYLENYVDRANQVISYLRHKPWVDHGKRVVAGHSQGTKIAAQLVIENSHGT